MNVCHLFRHMFIIYWAMSLNMFPARLNWGARLHAPKGFPPPHPIWSQCTSDIHFLMDRDGDLPYILVFRTGHSPYAALRLCTLFLLGTIRSRLVFICRWAGNLPPLRSGCLPGAFVASPSFLLSSPNFSNRLFMVRTYIWISQTIILFLYNSCALTVLAETVVRLRLPPPAS